MKNALVWLSRCNHTRGFGVQSPADYHYIRYVVNEHYPYYAYDELLKHFPTIDRKTIKLCRLYFRMANHRQPDYILDYRPPTSAYAEYMKAGCRKAVVRTIENIAEINTVDHVELLRVSIDDKTQELMELVLTRTDEQSVIVLEGIKQNKQSRHIWHKLLQDERCVIMLDLYYCGIIFFNKQRYKQNYIVNF